MNRSTTLLNWERTHTNAGAAASNPTGYKHNATHDSHTIHRQSSQMRHTHTSNHSLPIPCSANV